MHRHEDRGTDERIRRHVRGPLPEHPVPHASQARPAPGAREPQRVSVMTWLVAVGHVVVRRLRGVPPSSSMVRLHPKQ